MAILGIWGQLVEKKGKIGTGKLLKGSSEGFWRGRVGQKLAVFGIKPKDSS